MALLALRHIVQYGKNARALYIRRSHAGLADFELICRELFAKTHGTSARYNAAQGFFRFPDGGTFELNQLENHSEFAKFQGRSISLLLVDEAGQYPTPDLIDLLRSNLRGPADMPLRMILAANPGGPGHHWIQRRYITPTPCEPFFEPKSKRKWVTAPSTFVDNEFIDRDAYRDQIESATPHDAELRKAWLSGSWFIARGAFFADTLDENRNAVDLAKWTEIPKYHGWNWDAYLAHDFGSSAPSVTYVFLQSPGAVGPDGRFYPRGSLVVVDEFATNKSPDQLNDGLQYTVPILAERILEMCRKWKMQPHGVADDAIFAKQGMSAGSISDEFRRCGVFFSPARKADRVSGWQLMRRLLADAGKPDCAGLYISRGCEYWWATAPFIGRDPKKIEDVDSQSFDHGVDAIRYGCLRLRQQVRTDIIVVP